MRLAMTLAAVLLTASSVAYAGNSGGKGGKDGKGSDPAASTSVKGDEIAFDGSEDDAAKCRKGTAGAALCRQKGHK